MSLVFEMKSLVFGMVMHNMDYCILLRVNAVLFMFPVKNCTLCWSQISAVGDGSIMVMSRYLDGSVESCAIFILPGMV